jgi:hypothetical protein
MYDPNADRIIARRTRDAAIYDWRNIMTTDGFYHENTAHPASNRMRKNRPLDCGSRFCGCHAEKLAPKDRGRVIRAAIADSLS